MADDDPFYAPNAKPPPPRVARPGELLFEFVRASDAAPVKCELRFHGESYGWEAQFFERGEVFYSHGGFVTRALAVQWAETEREAIGRPHNPSSSKRLWMKRSSRFRRLAEREPTRKAR